MSALYQPHAAAQESNDEHAAIVMALAEGDMATAGALMRLHIDAMAARLDEKLARKGHSRERLRAALSPGAAEE